jgi:cell division protein FtsX
MRTGAVALIVAVVGAVLVLADAGAATPIRRATVATALNKAPGCSIVVTMSKTSRPQEVGQVGNLLARSGDFKLIIFIPKAVAFAAMKKAQPGLAGPLPFNPLPDAYNAELSSPTRAPAAVATVRKWQGVATVVATPSCPSGLAA